ncbi:hypothetical protein [Dietzia sp. 179-F 9C3 NHS]|uniref:hypothetical protein n=1 Tax=Dietzia sp. 179-F 9C3 NHS TaxID=3374295 RepID=UPI00387A0554
MAEHDDWDDDWDEDDQDVEPYVPNGDASAPTAPDGESTTVPASSGPIPPAYSDEPDHEHDDYMIAAPPVEEFAERPTVARSRNRPTRARAVTQSGESTDLDPMATPEPEPEPGRRRGCLVAGLVLLLVSAILAVMAWALVTMGPLSGLLGEEDEDLALPPASTSSAPPMSSSTTTAETSPRTASQAADEECSDAPRGTTAGNGPGSRDSGPEVILAFDHAYYVDRNGTKARGYMSDEITGTTAETLQEAIDALPPETSHCLKIKPKPEEQDVYLVELIVFRGSGDDIVKDVDEQTIYVEKKDDKYTIVGIIND